MRRPHPSLVRRLTVAFVFAHAVSLLLFLAAIWPFVRSDDEDQLGPDVAIALIRDDVVARDGTLTLRPGAQIIDLAHRSPQLWFMVRGQRGALDWGPVPAEARRMLGALPPVVKSAEFGDIGAQGRAGDASIATHDTTAGRLLIAAGGVPREAITFGTWVRHLHRESYALLALVSALFTLTGGVIAIPVVLRSLRPTARSAEAIDGSDLQQRLPESGAVKELLPIVRAFNAALDRLSEAFERRRRFIADVAHELRTPVAVLNMHVEALPDGAKKGDLQRTVFRLGQMVGQMLDAERLASAGRNREPLDLVRVAREVSADVAPLAIANGYDLAFNTTCDSLIVHGDSHAIRRAISNLLGNAIAHGGGSGTIEVRVSAAGAVEVCDEGPGVAPEARERIFEPFHRERWDRDGCGLGLHLVREIMQAHGGTARLVDSRRGATFRLQFVPQR